MRNPQYSKHTPRADNGASAITLYSDDRENVCVETWEAGSHQTIKDHKGIEVL